MQEIPVMTQVFLVANLMRMKTIHERIRALRKKTGLSIERFADKIDVSWQTVQQWENGSSAPSRKRLPVVAAELGTTVEYLLTGTHAPDEPQASSHSIEEPGAQYIVDLNTHPGTFPIRKVIFKISGGIAGFSVEYLDNGDGEPLYLQRSWAERKGYDPSKLYAARIGGKSMEPTMRNEDLIVVNTGDVKRKGDGVFAFYHEGEFTVKRLQYKHRRWYLLSDNPDQSKFPPVECGDSTYILGRIVLHQSETI